MHIPFKIARRSKLPAIRRGGEAGYALTELLVVAAVLVVVLGAVLAFGETTQRIAPRDQERSHVIREGQVGLHRMTRELRHTYTLNAYDQYSMDVQLVDGTRVRYDCNQPHPTDDTYRRCLRFENGVGPGEMVVDRVLNPEDADPVFSYTFDGTNLTHVEARIELPARGDLKAGHGHRITYADGFYPRNVGA